jgi:exodeoxyribonuclease VII large subunit
LLGLPVVEPLTQSLFPRPERSVWSVFGLVQAVAETLAGRFAACTVRGELTSYSRAGSGHCYFCLKDADGESAMIRCAMFRRAASLLDFNPADGQLVELRGRLGVYETRGELQFIVEAMQRAGTGALYEQFLRLKARLEADGLFDVQRKRAVPAFPRRVGIVTSLGAAALHDVLSSFTRRAPHVELVIYPSPVQGSEAPPALVRAIQEANRRAEVDTLLLCRGGGAIEDLWAFNDERVVRAIVASSLPVISGVGHETDFTLADFAADLRAPTPTAAAELASPASADCLDVLQASASAMQRRVQQTLDSQAQRLDSAAGRMARPSHAVQRQSHALAMLAQRLAATLQRGLPMRAAVLQSEQLRARRAVSVAIAARGEKLASLEARLQALDPRRVLERGYAWLADESGRAVLSVGQLSPGQSLQAVLADGSAEVEVRRVVGS